MESSNKQQEKRTMENNNDGSTYKPRRPRNGPNRNNFRRRPGTNSRGHNPLEDYGCNLSRVLSEKGIIIKGVEMKLDVFEYLKEFMSNHQEVQRIAVVGFHYGQAAEAFLQLNSQAKVYVFDNVKLVCEESFQYLYNNYNHRIMMFGGPVESTISLLEPFLSSERFDIIYFDGHVYDKNVEPLFDQCKKLCYEDTYLFVENIKPYSNTGKAVSKAWNDYAQKGIIEEIEVRGFDNLQRCIGLGMFKMTVEPLDAETMTKAMTFWRTDPKCLLYYYGKQIDETTAGDKARQLWEEMDDKGIQKDKYAYNSYLKKLQQFNYDKDYINTVKREMEYRFHEA